MPTKSRTSLQGHKWEQKETITGTNLIPKDRYWSSKEEIDYSWTGGRPTPGSGDQGGSMLLLREGVDLSRVPTYTAGTGMGTGGRGLFVSNGPLLPTTEMGYPRPRLPSASEINHWGVSGHNMARPTKSNSDLAVSLAELAREGLPKIIGAKAFVKDGRNAFQKGGDEYLNYQFGIAPLLAELRALADSVRRSDQIIDQYRRDASRLVRRRISILDETVLETPTVYENRVPWFPVMNSYIFHDGTPKGTYTRQTRTFRKVWFSGAFRYELPLGSSPIARTRRFFQEADKLYGVVPDPELVWNLTPWSWLLDWHASIGDTIGVISDQLVHGLTSHHSYLMVQTRTETVHSWEPDDGKTYRFSRPTGDAKGGSYSRAPGASIGSTSFTTYSEVKARYKSGPFGFGLDTSDYSPYQLGIIAALAASKAGRRR